MQIPKRCKLLQIDSNVSYSGVVCLGHKDQILKITNPQKHILRFFPSAISRIEIILLVHLASSQEKSYLTQAKNLIRKRKEKIREKN